MKTRALLFLIFTITIFAVGALITVLFNMTPSSREAIMVFYGSFILSLFGFFFFILYGYHYYWHQTLPPWQETAGSFRIALITALTLAALLALTSIELLNVATFIIIIVAAVMVELIYRRRKIITKSR